MTDSSLGENGGASDVGYFEDGWEMTSGVLRVCVDVLEVGASGHIMWLSEAKGIIK